MNHVYIYFRTLMWIELYNRIVIIPLLVRSILAAESLKVDADSDIKADEEEDEDWFGLDERK